MYGRSFGYYYVSNCSWFGARDQAVSFSPRGTVATALGVVITDGIFKAWERGSGRGVAKE